MESLEHPIPIGPTWLLARHAISWYSSTGGGYTVDRLAILHECHHELQGLRGVVMKDTCSTCGCRVPEDVILRGCFFARRVGHLLLGHENGP